MGGVRFAGLVRLANHVQREVSGLITAAQREQLRSQVRAAIEVVDRTVRGLAARIVPETVERAEVIFVMDVAQLVALHSRFPQARGRTFLLTCLAPAGPLEIRDPVDGDESVFQSCYEHIVQAVDPIIQTLAHSA